MSARFASTPRDHRQARGAPARGAASLSASVALSCLEPVLCGWRRREIVLQLTKREIARRYRRALLGLFWGVLHPVIYLAALSFAFGVMHPDRAALWPVHFESDLGFTMPIFVGLIVFWLAAEVLNRAPDSIRSEADLVKGVAFPLEVLAWVSLGQAVFGAAIRSVVCAIAYLAILGAPPPTAVLLPLVIFPLLPFLVAGAWVVSSSAVLIPDLKELVPVLVIALLFLSGVFYPLSAVPEPYHRFMLLNPVAFTIEQARSVALWGEQPDWAGLAVYLAAGALAMWLGLLWFQKLRGKFAGAV